MDEECVCVGAAARGADGICHDDDEEEEWLGLLHFQGEAERESFAVWEASALKIERVKKIE